MVPNTFIASLPREIINEQLLKLRDLANGPSAGKEWDVDLSSKRQVLLDFLLAVEICSQCNVK